MIEYKRIPRDEANRIKWDKRISHEWWRENGGRIKKELSEAITATFLRDLLYWIEGPACG